MTQNLFVARLTYKNNRLDLTDHAIVGVFSTEQLAYDAIENLVEGTLDVSFDAQVISKSVERHLLDQDNDAFMQTAADSFC